MTVGERLQQYRKNLGLSQEELSQRLFVSRQTVSQWETDQTLPTVDNLIRIKEIFGVSLDALVCEENAAEPSESEEAPSETYRFSLSDEEIKTHHHARMVSYLRRPFLNVLLLLLVTVISILQGKYSTDARVLVVFVFVLILIRFIIRCLMMRKMQKQIDQILISRIYQYDFYRTNFTMRIEKDGALSSFTVIPYDTVSCVESSDGLTSVYYNKKRAYTLLRTADLRPDSVIFQLAQRTPEKRVYRKAYGLWSILSWTAFVLSIASIPLMLAFHQIRLGIFGIDSESLSLENILKSVLFLPLPIASIVIGCVLKAKGQCYRKNIIVGIIMTILLTMAVAAVVLEYLTKKSGIM